MEMKKYLSGLSGYVRRGFRHERYDITTLASRKDAPVSDFCSLIKVEPVGFNWVQLRMVVGGPISTSGTLELFSRRIRREASSRYTLNFYGNPTAEHQACIFGIPMPTETANVGIIGVYFTLADGSQHRYITRSTVTLTRGRVLLISVPEPVREAKGEYVKPTVTVLDGEARRRAIEAMADGQEQ